MKKTIIIFTIFFLVIFLSLYSTYSCQNKCFEIINGAEKIERCLEIEEKNSVLKKVERLTFLWEKYRKILRIYLKRKNLEDITKEITSLKSYIIFSKSDFAFNKLKSIKRICLEIIDELKPDPNNIL